VPSGRPLRFLGGTLAGWVALRVLVLTGGATPGAPAPEGVPPLLVPPARAEVVPAWPVAPVAARPVSPAPATSHPGMRPRPEPAPIRPVAIALAPHDAPPPARQTASPVPEPQGSLPPPLRPAHVSGPSRWSGSAWAIARGTGRGDALSGSQLGGSQAGVRVAYALGAARRVALVGRLASPLEGSGAEAALGVEYRAAPGLRLFAEQRFVLDGGRGGPSAGAIGGVDRRFGRFRLEAYGQAGVIARESVEGFADGAARLTSGLAAGPVRLDLGIGAWGGAQRGAERLDVGPTVGAALPVAGRTLRLTLDWRERVAGGARPGSGPALSLGTDF
jgi:hypothetical protein